jgi:hypothetical protein
MSENEAMHVKVTINDLYKEQQETNKLLIQLAADLRNMSDLPDRMRAVEKYQDENAWIPRVLWTALTSGILALGTAFFTLITRG